MILLFCHTHTCLVSKSPSDATKRRSKGRAMWCDTSLRAGWQKEKGGKRDEKPIWQRVEEHMEWQWLFNYQLWAFSSCLQVWINITVTTSRRANVQTSIPTQTSWRFFCEPESVPRHIVWVYLPAFETGKLPSGGCLPPLQVGSRPCCQFICRERGLVVVAA